MEERETIILFGGAFDPPHSGHLDVIVEGFRRISDKIYNPKEMWIMPCLSGDFGRQPFHMAAFHHRVSMLRDLTANLNGNIVKITLHELDMPVGAGAYAVVRSLINKHPNKNFIYLMGYDQAVKIRQWRNSRDLIKTIPFVVVNRACDHYIPYIQWVNRAPHHNFKDSIHPTTVSSTKIRNDIRLYGTLTNPRYREQLTNGIIKYIEEHKLYR